MKCEVLRSFVFFFGEPNACIFWNRYSLLLFVLFGAALRFERDRTIFLDSFILPVQSWSSKISTEPCHMHILVCEESMHPWSRWYHLYDLFSLSVTSRFARQALRNQQSTSTKTWLSCWMRPGWNLDVKISDQQMFLFGVFSCFLCWILPYDKYTLKRCVINVFWLFSIDVHLQMMDILNCRYRYIYILWIYLNTCVRK